MNKTVLTNSDIIALADYVAQDIAAYRERIKPKGGALKVYAVPRGGIPAYFAVSASKRINNMQLVDTPSEADIFIDDIIDSCATIQSITPERRAFALIDKRRQENKKFGWVVFPWEVTLKGNDTSAEDIVTRLIEYIGEDITREGLRETPKRVLKAWKEWTSGYRVDIPSLFKTFDQEYHDDYFYKDMVIIKDIKFYSHCEHHLAPFFGTVSIGYIPDHRIVGLSKLTRVVEAFAKRLQVQERLTHQIAEAIHSELAANCAVLVKARHMCVESRGVCKPDQTTITSAVRGVFDRQPETRAEFLGLLK